MFQLPSSNSHSLQHHFGMPPRRTSTGSTGLFEGSPLSVPDQGVPCVHQLSYHHSRTPCSGLVAYRELTEVGLDVRIFERDSVPGGNWHYTEEVPLDAPVPNAPTAISDFVPSLPPASVDLPYSEEFEDSGEIWRDHRAPKPIWDSLTLNAPSVRQPSTPHKYNLFTFLFFWRM